MKSILVLIVTTVSLMSFAAKTTPIDRELESVVIENPTMEHRYFCGVDGRIVDAAVFVCASQGYPHAQILERAMAGGAGALCWTVEPRGGSHYFELRQANAVLTRVKCTRPKMQTKPPIAEPVPIDPPDLKPDPGTPYPVPTL